MTWVMVVASCCHRKWLTYSMVQSPSWEANWFAASQVARILKWPHHKYSKCVLHLVKSVPLTAVRQTCRTKFHKHQPRQVDSRGLHCQQTQTPSKVASESEDKPNAPFVFECLMLGLYGYSILWFHEKLCVKWIVCSCYRFFFAKCRLLNCTLPIFRICGAITMSGVVCN